MLTKAGRPDGAAAECASEASGRRLWTRSRGGTTRWLWEGNLPIHEWVETPAPEQAATAPPPTSAVIGDEIADQRRRAELNERPAQGPPATADRPITWLFEPESFAPLAKLVGDARHGIVTDPLGPPMAMYDAAGQEVWSASIDVYGNLRDLKGDRQACP